MLGSCGLAALNGEVVEHERRAIGGAVQNATLLDYSSPIWTPFSFFEVKELENKMV